MGRAAQVCLAVGMFLVCGALRAEGGGASVPVLKSETFLELVMAGHVDKAYDGIFKGSSIPKEKPEEFERAKKQTTMGLSMYGKAIGYDFVCEKNYGTAVTRVVYILKTDRVPLTWVFDYYRASPSSPWLIVNVNFNDELKGLEP
jgi:hypothetical protein